jgi:DNA-binding NtrC family response regulator
MLTSQKRIQLLAVMPDEWLTSLRDAIANVPVNILTARNWQSAQSTLIKNPEIEVVLIASLLPDATWKEVLAGVSNLERPPWVVVAARFADASLWYEILELGAYDLTVHPFRPEALIHVVISASADCRQERDRIDWAEKGHLQHR